MYLDTSVINFLFATDSPELQKITQTFFTNFIRPGVYQACVSDFVLDELRQTPDDDQRKQLLNVLDGYEIEILTSPGPAAIEELAQQYLTTGALPPNKVYDALHVAFCTVAKLDYLVSWNFKHLANVNRERRLLAVNQSLGYLHSFRILNPLDLLGDGN
ncbi:PIN domain-containing protein [Hymenobacter sp.]|uniref:PIN domain-containing protein n=1 Tax=Hymenobacter sp. TaxID=1898978 RepID=UPI00286CD0C9|nr:PIN domain-containing protein [Hymenobacter sp.]